MADATLTAAQERLGAVFSDKNGRQPRAVHFGDPRTEYTAARNDAAVFDLSDRAQIEVTGQDRVSFLNNFCTNDVKALQSGQGCEAFLTNVKGRVVGHVFVFVAPESIWLESVPAAEEALIAHLDRYVIREDVELQARTAEFGELLVSGPKAAERLSALQIGVDDLAPHAHTGIASLEFPLFVRRVDLLGTPGYLLSVRRESLTDLWTRLTDAGIPALTPFPSPSGRGARGEGIPPAGRAAFEALRIEAGFPLYGIDVTDDHLAPEVGRDKQAISYTKGCYLGQEPIARIDALGHVNRKLCGLKLASGPVPEPGSPIVAGDTDKPVGQVTSAAWSPADDKPVALAYLRSKYTASETQLTVQTGETEVVVTVVRRAS